MVERMKHSHSAPSLDLTKLTEKQVVAYNCALFKSKQVKTSLMEGTYSLDGGTPLFFNISPTGIFSFPYSNEKLYFSMYFDIENKAKLGFTPRDLSPKQKQVIEKTIILHNALQQNKFI